MLEEMQLYHTSLLFIGVLILIWGAMIPFVYTDKNIIVERLKLHIGIFHGSFLMLAFSGMVMMFFAKIEFNLNMFFMVLGYFLITFFEAKKYFTIRKIFNNVKEGDPKKLTLIYEGLNLAVIFLIILFNLKG